MPPKKNDALIEKFKRANEMKKAYSFNATSGTINLKDKIQKAVKQIFADYELKINAVVQLCENVNERLQEIESILFEEDPSLKKD